MRWRGRRRSDNVEDRRGLRAGRGLVGGSIGVVAIVLLAIYFGVDPARLMLGAGTPPGDDRARQQYAESAAEAQWREQVAVVLADTEQAWAAEFRELGGSYREPKLVLFAGTVDSGCGYPESATGPFYCPADERVFIDLSFFGELDRRLVAGGDFARAYVVAHEVGHHVQKLLGAARRVQELRRRVGDVEGKQLSVRLELQADCYAGFWARQAAAAGLLEPGDAEEALAAASAIGDDTLRRSAGRALVPDSFTHGSSEQRMRWFRRGLEAASAAACDTFAEADV